VSRVHLGILIAVAVSLVGIGADSMLKAASQQSNALANRWFVAGIGLTILFALGWLVLMRYMKLATAGAVYAVASATLLAIIAVVFFDERLSAAEITGVGLALGSVALLARFTA
jgi:multidrug transporter EmrE-like cation transporter